MMATSVATIGAASAPTFGVESLRPMRGVANRHPMSGVNRHPMCAGGSDRTNAGSSGPSRAKESDPTIVGVFGRTTAEIVVAGPTPARAMAATTRCRMANAGLTFGAEPTRPMN